MIRINLALKKQASFTATSTKAAEPAPTQFTAIKNFSKIQPSLVLRLVGPFLFCVVTYFAYDYYVTVQMEEMQAEINKIENQKAETEKELARIRGFEKTKLELERTEKILRTKIETIQRLVQNRDYAFRSLIALSQSLPRETWLNEITETETEFQLKGSATDVGPVSDLMTRLGQTIYFKDVTLKGTTNDVAAGKASFELSARRE